MIVLKIAIDTVQNLENKEHKSTPTNNNSPIDSFRYLKISKS